MSDGDPPILPPLRDVIARHGLAARRALGQHFLLDLNLTGRIARAAGDLGAGTTIEIGPGPGGLTRALLAHGARRVIAIELDPRCVEALQELAAAYPGRLEIIAGDAMAIDPAKLGDAPRRIVANLPYNVSTALLAQWLPSLSRLERLVLMFQKEVAERLAAKPGTRDYGRLSVALQWRAEVKRLFDLPPRAFTPPPKVTSSVVEIRPLPQPRFAADAELLERLTAAAFNQRRKMLRQSLRSAVPDAAALLEAAGIDGTQRAEDLSVEQFCALALALAKSRGRMG
ncbi:MAG TPA: 16S rRNA (adenine(1518)-N(6)/adenine(1519)-N(6))-dimethyltransferase RsmA [Hypericibacter adhaerens]|jgi:16S rRNA (adenine1518-N6/adenine1519-N6)-dimethyltransferase|uniref:16S rRNA (adenine(1518)-N(6)/adenine(1519)-N(6))- dimethyltransferase RsmA n=1 Tax=Hypericibacter adhaerens TaxID=2602016 RepID=UPI002C19816A|nr:16S rRNA (adenine(1518)-N(6)/adenine(1519)-N(6))-dimethyltransferase RsmA [Hypericibacter adhaerens]HWA45048.1 16S rRNA (adenine(1518)-N(6)/adenine(1519)-N(6))-dimethyltransferase RsmA [Hypericibacter adhaerens]